MSGDMRPYVVRQGDYLTKLAFVHGFDVDEVWGHEKNKALAELRKDPNVLAPGDVIYLPVKPKEGLPIQKGATNKYVAKVPKVPVNLRFQDASGPMGNVKFVVEGGLATPAEGTTDGEGKIKLRVPAYVRELRVRFPEEDRTSVVRIGDLDPLEERSGIAARLAQLGYLSAPRPGRELTDARLSAALHAFQEAQGIEPTGEADDATRAAVKKAYGA